MVALLALGSGCARYRAQPISRAEVDRRLTPPALADLTVAASKIDHPILRPMKLDPAHGLSPEQAGLVAVLVNPQLRAERDQRALADAQLVAAGLLPNPTLTAGLELPSGNDPADSFTGYNFGVDWDITALLTRDAKMGAAKAAAASVALDVAWKEWQVAEAAKIAAYDVIAAEQALHSANDADEQLAQNVRLVRQAVDRHDKTLLDLAVADSAAQDAHAAALDSSKELHRQRMVLNRSLGLPANDVIPLRLDGALPSRLDPPTTQQVMQHLETRRLDLVALRKGYQSQDQTLRAAILAQFPKISLGLTGARDTSNVKTIGIGATIDLPIFDRNQATIRTETATREKLFDEYVNRVFEARSDAAAAIAEIESTNLQIAAAEAAMPARENLVRTFEQSLGRGDVDALSFYTARGELAQKRVELIKLKQQLVQNWIALELAAGRPLNAPSTQEAAR